jgi:hypothetical protein
VSCYCNTPACLPACRTIIEEQGQAVCDPGVPLTEYQRVAAYRLNQLLARQLPRKLALAARDVSDLRRHTCMQHL